MINMTDQTNFQRHRRLRSSATMRSLVRETHLSCNDFIYPLFVVAGKGIKKEVPSMPGVFQLSLDQLGSELAELKQLGIGAVMYFGVPEEKDELGKGAYAEDGIVQQAIRFAKAEAPEILAVADTCLCEYTSHGHCGVIHGETV